MILSKNGQKLIKHYGTMASDGIVHRSGKKVENVYNDFELTKFRHIVLPSFKELKIESVLDYGGGGSNWDKSNFDPETGQTAKQFFAVKKVTTFEPARQLNKKERSDCVTCVDVLEHIFLADVSNIVRELFSLANKLLVINVACYEASALLPNGENAHITVRSPDWWNGLVNAISNDFPEVEVLLICSETFSAGIIYKSYKSKDWDDSKTFTVSVISTRFGDPVDKFTPEDIVAGVDQLTKKYPKTIPFILKILKNNNKVLNSTVFD